MAELTTVPFLEGLAFGEAPRWRAGRLWYSDFYAGTVCSVAPDGREPRVEARVDAWPSGLGWLPDGRLLVVAMRERAVLRREEDGLLREHARLDALAEWHANDMVVDPTGRAFVGNFGFDLDAFLEGRCDPAPTTLARVDPDGTVHAAAHDLAFPNGMAFLEHGRVLVVAETFASALTAFSVGPTGELGGRRPWAMLPGCAPDGICADREGALWVADALAPRCLRVGSGGSVLAEVTTSQPCYACALGGTDGRTLYCMTAPTSHAPELIGRRMATIEQARVAVGGAGSP